MASLVLPIDEPERLVSISGKLALRILDRDSENPEVGTVDRFIIKMDPASFEIACRARDSLHSYPRFFFCLAHAIGDLASGAIWYGAGSCNGFFFCAARRSIAERGR